MPAKRRGPLQIVQRETDDIKRQVDALVQQAAKADVSENTEALQRCRELQRLVDDIMKRLKKLSKADEPAPVGNYDQCKREEEKRLLTLHDHLQSLALQLLPHDETAGPSSSHTEQDSEEENSDEEDESSEEEDAKGDVHEEDDDADSADEDTDMAAAAEQGSASYITLSSFTAEEEGDLSIQKGEILKVLSKNKDGWWLAQNSNGQKGMVPKTFLKMSSSPQDSERENEDEEDSEEEQESRCYLPTLH